MMMKDYSKGVVALETTNAQFLRLKKGLKAYLAQNVEIIQESRSFAKASREIDRTLKEERYEPVQYSIEIPQPFCVFLFRLIEAKKLEDVELYKKAQIDRKLFSKMKEPGYQPSKETVFKLILAMELEIREAKEFLEDVGYSFSRASKSDLVVKYCIENRCFDIFRVNELLLDNGQPAL